MVTYDLSGPRKCTIKAYKIRIKWTVVENEEGISKKRALEDTEKQGVVLSVEIGDER